MTALTQHPISLTIAVRSPFVMAGVDASGVGIDTRALRDEQGRPVLPGDHLKGLLREAFLALQMPEHGAGALSLATVLGRESAYERKESGKAIEETPDNNLPERGRLRLRDAVATQMRYPAANDAGKIEPDDRCIATWRGKAAKGKQDHEGRPDITRITIDAQTGTVSRGMLQVVELAAPLGAVALFESEAVFFGTQQERDALAPMLQNALGLIPYFGGLRSVGFGEHCAELSRVTFGTAAPIVPAATQAPQTTSERQTYEGTFGQSFLLSAARLADNVYEGSAVIPGGAIKGALGDLLELGGKRPMERNSPHGRALARMRIAHARPLHRDDRRKAPAGDLLEAGRALPLSLMRNPAHSNENPAASEFQCAFEAAEPGLIDGACAAFQPDWKPQWFKSARLQGMRPEDALARLSRGHTRIDRKTGGADDQGLFVEALRGCTYDYGAEMQDGTEPSRCRFRFHVDCPDIGAWPADEQAAAADIVALLQRGLPTFGKTNALFSVQGATTRALPSVGAAPARWKVLLETDAVLADPDAPGAPGSVEAALRSYFRAILPEAELADWYARRKLVGRHVAMRRRADGTGARYRPWSVFTAGSCFLLRAPADHAAGVAKALQRLCLTGLPVFRFRDKTPELVTDWRDCPFVPENGYGEISVNDPVFDLGGAPVEARA